MKRTLAVMYASYSLRMDGEAIKESTARGHHNYKAVWSPVIWHKLPVLSEQDNCHDRQGVGREQ